MTDDGGSWGSFQSPIIGSDGVLIREVMKSLGFVAGVSGWELQQDGNAELNDVTVRGKLVTSNASGAFVLVEANGAFALVALQPPDSATPGVTFGSAFVYADSGGDAPALHINGPTVETPSFRSAGQLVLGVDLGSLDSTVGLSAGQVLVGPDQTEIGRGFVVAAEATADTAAITAETVVLTAGSKTYRKNRAFRVVSDSRYVLAAAAVTTPLALWRKGTTTAGVSLIDAGRFDLPASTNTFGRFLGGVFTTGPADVTTQICMTLSSPGTAVTQKGAAGSPRRFEIHDIGPASRYPNHTVLT